MTQVLVLKT